MTQTADRRTQRFDRRARMAVLIGILVVSTGLGLAHQFLGQAGPVGVDALCPFGAIESAYSLIMTGAFLQRIALSSLVLLVAVVGTAVVFRRSFCGNICPLGTLQELAARAGGKLFGKRPEVPAVIDKPARYLKYLVLAVVVVWSAFAAELVIRPYDPWAAFHHLASADLLTEFSVGFMVLLVSLAGSVVYDRFFCKYVCPMGAFLGLINRFGIFGVRRDAATCIDCGACDKACPVNIKVSETRDVGSAECLACNECVNACPVADTLYVSSRRGTRKVSPRMVLGATVAIFAGVVALTSVTGTFKWQNTSLAQEVKQSGSFDSSQIKGRMTLQEIADATGISKQEFKTRFKVSDSDFSKPIKDVLPALGFETDDLRTFVDDHLKSGSSGSRQPETPSPGADQGQE